MRPPAAIKDWLTAEQMLDWLSDAGDAESLQRRLAVWMTATGKLHAHHVAAMLGVSLQAVWLWIGQYNKHGPGALERQGKGGRTWSYLHPRQEQALLLGILKRPRGHLTSARRIKEIFENELGHPVSLPYIYKVLNAHNWPYVPPIPAQELPYHQRSDNFEKYTRPWLQATASPDQASAPQPRE